MLKWTMDQAVARGVEANSSRLRAPFRLRSLQNVAAWAAATLGALLLVSFACPTILFGATIPDNQNAVANAGYVGSRVCAKCHSSIYESFARTDMGRSMLEITPSLLERVPTSASIF